MSEKKPLVSPSHQCALDVHFLNIWTEVVHRLDDIMRMEDPWITSSWDGARCISEALLSASDSSRGLPSSVACFVLILGAAKPLLAASQLGKRLKYCAMPFDCKGGSFFGPAHDC